MPSVRMWIATSLLIGGLALAGPTRALTDLNHYVFVSSRTVPQVAVIDTETDAIVTRIGLPSVPRQTLISPRRGKLIVSDSVADLVYIVDLSTERIARTIDLGLRPMLMQLDSCCH